MKANGVPMTLLRLIFAVVFATTGYLLGRELFLHLISLHVANQAWLIALTIVVPVAGAVVGVVAAPPAQLFFEYELRQVESLVDRLTPNEVFGGAVGLIAGLLIAWLAKNVLLEFVRVAGASGQYLATVAYILGSIFAAYLGARVGAKQQLGAFVRPSVADKHVPRATAKIIDTSVIIDGRVLEIVQSGFLEEPVVVPRFVLRELQLIADSLDAMKRARGRRGLEVLAKLQEIVPIEIAERDYDNVAGGVDAKLVKLALERGGKLVTNDYNLNRVAHVEGVAVLNINELAAAVRPVVLPGEELRVVVVRDGKEPHQGVAYLEDGTMIVVENARRLVGEETDVLVTSVLQTVAGRMIFAKLKRAQVAQ
ncbi:MAG: PIN/TRAM domain-containing protein [Vulcanimicrobiaceae bacterium]